MAGKAWELSLSAYSAPPPYKLWKRSNPISNLLLSLRFSNIHKLSLIFAHQLAPPVGRFRVRWECLAFIHGNDIIGGLQLQRGNYKPCQHRCTFARYWTELLLWAHSYLSKRFAGMATPGYRTQSQLQQLSPLDGRLCLRPSTKFSLAFSMVRSRRQTSRSKSKWHAQSDGRRLDKRPSHKAPPATKWRGRASEDWNGWQAMAVAFRHNSSEGQPGTCWTSLNCSSALSSPACPELIWRFGTSPEKPRFVLRGKYPWKQC